jgi:Fe-S cluster biogenesis protein NfuA
MKVLSIQPTPNPNAYKFFLDRKLSAQPRELADASKVNGDVLSAALFAVPGVRSLFYMDDFVTVTWDDQANWRTVTDQVRTVLETNEVDGTQLAGSASAAVDAAARAVDDAGLMAKIEAVLDDRVRPALAGDGGGLEVIGLEDKVLRIRYQGACGTCPSSVAGTLMAIQNMLQSEVDEQLQVINA